MKGIQAGAMQFLPGKKNVTMITMKFKQLKKMNMNLYNS